MIYNDEHKVIFVHLIKTGGESVTHLLKGDVEKKFHLPVRCLFTRTCTDQGPGKGWSEKDMKAFPMLNNLYARPKVGRILERWENYTKFTIVRNPFSRLVSEYNYNVSKGIEKREFKETIKDIDMKDVWKKSQLWWLSHDNKVQVDTIMKLENIKNDFAELFPQLILPRKNKSKSTRPHTYYYDSQTRDIVSELYKDDIKEFNYKFDDIT